MYRRSEETQVICIRISRLSPIVWRGTKSVLDSIMHLIPTSFHRTCLTLDQIRIDYLPFKKTSKEARVAEVVSLLYTSKKNFLRLSIETVLLRQNALPSNSKPVLHNIAVSLPFFLNFIPKRWWWFHWFNTKVI
jgi:hypothetical protein